MIDNNKEKEILKICKELAEKIREISKSQKELWQLVPNLCLEANGRGGYSDHYQWAYTSGYWALGSSNDGYMYQLAIDLITGDIVRLSDDAPLASDEEIVKTLAINFYELDASGIVEGLKKDILKGEKDNNKEVKKWRESTRKKLKIEKVYKSRPKALKIEFSFFD